MGTLQGVFAWMMKCASAKKQCRSMFWRARGAVKKAMKKGNTGGKQQPRFQYDPSSYALNFDDGGKEAANGNNSNHGSVSHHLRIHVYVSSGKTATWVYVVWVDASGDPQGLMLRVKELC